MIREIIEPYGELPYSFEIRTKVCGLCSNSLYVSSHGYTSTEEESQSSLYLQLFKGFGVMCQRALRRIIKAIIKKNIYCATEFLVTLFSKLGVQTQFSCFAISALIHEATRAC